MDSYGFLRIQRQARMQTRIVTVDPGTGPGPDRMQTRIVTVDLGICYGFLLIPIDFLLIPIDSY